MTTSEGCASFVVAPGGLQNLSLVVAASRAGAIGVVDLYDAREPGLVRDALARAVVPGAGDLGVRLDGSAVSNWRDWIATIPAEFQTVILVPSHTGPLSEAVRTLRDLSKTVILEATSVEEAGAGEAAGVDAIIAKGNEAAGRVGAQTTFILLQRILPQVNIPVYAQGGIGLHTAAGCWACGARGFVLDWQLALVRESALSPALKSRIEQMDGRESRCYGQSLREHVRLLVPGGPRGADALESLERSLHADLPTDADRRHAWRENLLDRTALPDDEAVLPISQDVAFAPRFAERYRNVRGVLGAIQDQITANIETARIHRPLARGNGSAQVMGTTYPIVQGPMSRVSDTAAFAASVSEGGAMPVIAVAAMAPAELEPVLRETAEKLAGRPWGVGLLGFIDKSYLAKQVDLAKKYAPSLAVVAGGTPAQAAELQASGIRAYIHVPSTRLLSHFIQEGARSFILEGRECGGHIGPYAASVLWENAVACILDEVSEDEASEFDIWFAGGIHDELSASLVASVTAPLAARGIRVGVLMGTAYLFTEEAVRSGAIGEVFQDCIVNADDTDILDSGGGYEVRTAPCQFTDTFEKEKARLREEGKSAAEVRDALELLNLGRLRIAAKGKMFNVKSLDDPSLPEILEASEAEQKDEGCFMAGQVVSLRSRIKTISALHDAISLHGMDRLDTIPLPHAPPTIEIVNERPACDVAVIGMACIFPKAADLQTYWNNILNNVYAIEEVPSERWDWRTYFDTDPTARDKIYSRWGGFIDPIPFDPTQFFIPPNSIKSIDPLQLFPLEVVRRTLVDAGYEDAEFDRERTSVIFGVSGGMGDLGLMYAVRSAMPLLYDEPPEELLSQMPEWTEDTFPGLLANVVAGRIANVFNLGGANFTVDAACGSGLTAVYAGVREIINGSSDMAIVGASDVMQNPFGFLCFSKTRALSSQGIPRPFDAEADGITIGEGVASVFLKRRDLAERDGDRIYSVIRGVGAGSDGRGGSMTSPRNGGQRRAFDEAYRLAGVSPGTVELIEAHGTGTTLGDGVEATSIHQLMSDADAQAKTCAVGSVKSMIGHTKGCAGIAGLIKASLSLHHKVLPATMGVTRPAPQTCWDQDSPIYVNSETRPWLRSDTPRRAGVNAFGFGGSNFHVVLEEYSAPAAAPAACPLDDWPAELICLAAPSTQGIHDAVVALTGKLDGAKDVAFRSVAARVTGDSIRASKAAAEPLLRLAVVATDMDDLKAKLGTVTEALKAGEKRIRDPRGIYFSDAPMRTDHKVAFLFPGQASQRPGMMQDLATLFPEIRESFALADRVIGDRLPRRLSEYVYPPPSFSVEESARHMAQLTATQVAQPALGAVEVGLYKLMTLFGIRPDLAAGHSVGEYAAMHAAGILTEEATYDLLAERGRSVVCDDGETDTGGMIAVKASWSRIEDIVRDIPGVYPANLNAPSQTVLAGSAPSLQEASDRLNEADIPSVPIPVSCGFHSPLMSDARDAFAKALAQHSFSDPRIPLYSNVEPCPYPSSESEIRSLLSKHVVSPVRFMDEINAMYEDGARIFIELGPGAVLRGLLGDILGDRPHVAVGCDARSARHGVLPLLHALAELTAEGVDVDPRALFERRATEALSAKTLEPAENKTGAGKVQWMLAPDQVWPASGQRKTIKRMPAQNATQTRTASAAAIGATTPAAAPRVVEPPSPPSVQLPTAASVTGNGATDAARVEALVRYQKLMSQFLLQQNEIMMAFLNGSGNGATAPAMPADLMSKAAAAVQQITPAPGQSPAIEVPHRPVDLTPQGPAQQGPEPAVVAVTVEATEEGLRESLIELVAERTGYPPEMLDIDLDLEADLGIDSIKRVEIFTAFGKTMPNAPADLTEKVGSVRTLREAIQAVAAAPAEPDQSVAPVAVQESTAPADENLDEAQLTDMLIALVADRTGYPPEMLDIDLDLEADLGIDSIKRVEILTAFGKAMPTVPAAMTEEAGTARTLRDVVNVVLAQLTQDTPAVPPAQIAPGTEPGVKRYLVKLKQSALEASGEIVIPSGVIIITDDGNGAATSLQTEITSRGGQAVVIGHCVDEDSDGEVLQRNLADAHAVEALIASLRAKHGHVGGILHLLPLREAPAFKSLSIDEWQDLLDAEIKSLFYLLHYAAPDLSGDGTRWVMSCSTLGTTPNNGMLPKPAYPWRGGLMGLLKSVAMEWPNVLCRAVDIDRASPDEFSDTVLSELSSPSEGQEVYYRKKLRWVPTVAEAPLKREESEEIGLDADSVILAVGGARGITAEVLREFAGRYQPTLILSGRSPWPEAESAMTAELDSPTELRRVLFKAMTTDGKTPLPIEVEKVCRRILNNREMIATKTALETLGARVAYVQADAGDPDDVARLVQHIDEAYGRLDGVINGAGIIEDKLLQDKTPESFSRVFDVKARSVYALSKLLNHESLKFLVLFSSVAGWFGNRGQVDYSAANEVMNRTAMYLCGQWKRRVVAVNWGPWSSSGMATEGVQAQFSERDLDMVDPVAGSRYLMDEISHGDLSDSIVIAVGAGN